MGRNKYTKTWKRILIYVFSIVFSMLFIPNIFAANFQMEWESVNIAPETWTQIDLENTYDSPIVVAGPEYSLTTNPNGISVWTTNVTSNSFMLRTSDENLAAADSINVHYIVMEEGDWTLPDSNIKVEAGKLSTNKVGSAGGGNHQCPTYGETVTFTNPFDSNPLVMSTRGSDENPNVWAATFQNDPANQANPVPFDEMCIGLGQSKAISPGTIVNDETVYWIAVDEGNGTISGIEYEILWNLQDTGDSGANWINGYPDGAPFTQSWTHTWVGTPDVIIGSQTSTAGADGSWAVIYDTGDTSSIRMFVDEANERAHSGSESGGGWAFDTGGSFGNIAPVNLNISFLEDLIFLNENNTINATVTDENGNQTIDSVIATVLSPNSTQYNISLIPETIDENITTGDVEPGFRNYSAITGGETIGETGEVQLRNRETELIEFTQNYNNTPVIIAVATSQNNDNSPFIPAIHSINTTHANISLCRDNGATTCDNSYLSENVHYAIFDVDKSNDYSWIEVGRINVTTNGNTNGFSFAKTFANNPYIWALPQTYNINSVVTNGIAAHSWFTSITTTGANIIGCDHVGTGDNCGGTATEEFGYVAIDVTNTNLSNFFAGTQTITDSSWTAVGFDKIYADPRVFVMVNSETGPQDPAYPWARSVTSTGAEVRYCENDVANYCDTHNGEVTNWFVIENGPIAIGNGGDDTQKEVILETYNDIFSQVTHNITRISLEINVTNYNNSGSSNRGNSDPALKIELATGATNWQNVGQVNVTGNGLYSINITNPTIFDAWSSSTNRDLRISGVDLDYYSSTRFDFIEYDLAVVDVDYETYTSRWSSIFSNTQICGVYNLTNLYSTDRQGAVGNNSYTSVNFSIPCNPIINLISPVNNTKILGNGEVNLTWSVLSPDSTLNCDLYINSVFNQSISCDSSINNTISVNLGGGYYNWTINATDTNSLSSVAPEENFLIILAQNSRITKSISYINTDLYGISINVENKLNLVEELKSIDFVSNDFNYGSFSLIYDWFKSVIGEFSGDIFGWNLTLAPMSTTQINYSITKDTNEYNLLDQYIIGME